MSENLQPTCNQLATDLISRQAAIEHLKKRLYETALNNITEKFYYEEIADNRVDVWMNELPSAQPERNPGKTLAEEVERIKREITDIFAKQMSVQIEVIVDECKQAQKDFADMRVGDTIYRQAAIDAFMTSTSDGDKAEWCKWVLEQLPSAQPGPLTDEEQRIFLLAMAREEMVCKHIDDVYKDSYEDGLVRICHEITRKVKGVLWT